MPLATGDVCGLGRSMEGSVPSSWNFSTTDLMLEPRCCRREGVTGSSTLWRRDGVAGGEGDEEGEGESEWCRVVDCCSLDLEGPRRADENLTRWAADSGSSEGERGKSEPGMVMEGLRLRMAARGRGVGEGGRWASSDSSVWAARKMEWRGFGAGMLP